jgi:phenylacetate-CoA ligase
MRGQARIPFRPPAELERLQNRHMRAMLRHAYASVPHYRESMDRLHLRPEDFRSGDDLRRLPLIETGDLREHADRFLSNASPRDSYFPLRTGGSTGDPRLIYHNAAGIFRNAAHGERERSLVCGLLGKRFGYRETVIISLNSTAAKLQEFVYARLLTPRGVRIRRQYLSLMDPPEKNVGLINEFNPDLVHSYGSYLGILFSYLAGTGAEFHRPAAVTYSSDALSDSARQLITGRFGIPVFSTYQANEALKMGFECERHRGLHLNADLYPLRIVDESGEDVPAGQMGEVVVSNLVNTATVLLNYRIGDVAAFLPGPCPCGRTLPLLSFPPGRSDDLLRLPSGRVIHPQSVRTMFTMEEKVWQYQVVQRSATEFEVKVVVAQDADVDGIRRRVAAKFLERFGAEVTASILFVDQIDRTVGGKFRPIMSLKSPDGKGSAGEGNVRNHA